MHCAQALCKFNVCIRLCSIVCSALVHRILRVHNFIQNSVAKKSRPPYNWRSILTLKHNQATFSLNHFIYYFYCIFENNLKINKTLFSMKTWLSAWKCDLLWTTNTMMIPNATKYNRRLGILAILAYLSASDDYETSQFDRKIKLNQTIIDVTFYTSTIWFLHHAVD